MFRTLGAETGEASLPTLAEYDACGWLIALSELHSAHEAQVRSDGGERYGSLLRQGLALGGMLSAADYVQAARSRQALCRATAAATQAFDLLFTAVQSAEAAPMQDAAGSLPFQKPNFTMPFNVTGQPAMSVYAPASARAGCRWPCSSSPGRSRSPCCSARRTPMSRRHLGASGVRRSDADGFCTF